MSYILNIDTSGETGFVSIGENGAERAVRTNRRQNDHAAFLHTAVLEVLTEVKVSINVLDAIAVTSGPGSYTGLRVGLSAAKGFAYAANKPLITISVTEAMANQLILNRAPAPGTLLCPMIDARRLEVFTALYDHNGAEILAPYAAILDEKFLADQLPKCPIIFFGNGAQKWHQLPPGKNLQFDDETIFSHAMCMLAQKKFLLEHFADTALSIPLYVKEFYDKA